MNSALPRIVQPVSSEARFSLMRGVRPTAAATPLEKCKGPTSCLQSWADNCHPKDGCSTPQGTAPLAVAMLGLLGRSRTGSTQPATRALGVEIGPPRLARRWMRRGGVEGDKPRPNETPLKRPLKPSLRMPLGIVSVELALMRTKIPQRDLV